jgi:hypothetical protein
MSKTATLRRSLERLGPYQSLVLVLIPLAIVEPAKLAAILIAGEGHWLTGTAVLVVAYGLSLFVVERLFRLLKPNLLRLRWFARLWGWWEWTRRKTLRWLSPASSQQLRRKPSE